MGDVDAVGAVGVSCDIGVVSVVAAQKHIQLGKIFLGLSYKKCTLILFVRNCQKPIAHRLVRTVKITVFAKIK